MILSPIRPYHATAVWPLKSSAGTRRRLSRDDSPTTRTDSSVLTFLGKRNRPHERRLRLVGLRRRRYFAHDSQSSFIGNQQLAIRRQQRDGSTGKIGGKSRTRSPERRCNKEGHKGDPGTRCGPTWKFSNGRQKDVGPERPRP